MYDKIEILIAALEDIKTDCGKVCKEFEICTHEACRSSVDAWFIADKALKDIECIEG